LLSEKRTEAERRDLYVRARENLSLHFQLAQQRPTDGIQKIAAEFFPGKLLLVQERHRIALARQRNGRRGAGRAGADNGDVKVFHDYLDTEIGVFWRKEKTETSKTGPTAASKNSARHSFIVKALLTERGPSKRVISFRVNRRVIKRMP